MDASGRNVEVRLAGSSLVHGERPGLGLRSIQRSGLPGSLVSEGINPRAWAARRTSQIQTRSTFSSAVGAQKTRTVHVFTITWPLMHRLLAGQVPAGLIPTDLGEEWRWTMAGKSTSHVEADRRFPDSPLRRTNAGYELIIAGDGQPWWTPRRSSAANSTSKTRQLHEGAGRAESQWSSTARAAHLARFP